MMSVKEQKGKTPIYFFSELLGEDLVASFNKAHGKGELSISQCRGIIAKDEGSPLGLRNWIPITSLIVACKLNEAYSTEPNSPPSNRVCKREVHRRKYLVDNN